MRDACKDPAMMCSVMDVYMMLAAICLCTVPYDDGGLRFCQYVYVMLGKLWRLRRCGYVGR